ncbi:SDR family NAD(P)-dependent oxidoreductase [Brevibacillus sp. B_LB10_24]|uniref:SDR family NAD(P)-dependent oxidoreductase n=1 Tax=Brevibacillus sp. B_LB10_24 TaxID=3380645 RepID=UPI0038B84875
MTIAGKAVIVTGAGRGIGRTIAITYAQQGASVIIADKDPDGLQQTARLIEDAGGSVYSRVLDLSRPEEIERFFGDIQETAEGIGILINNAGLSKWKSPYELTVDEWDTIIDTNLRGTFLCSREAAKIMRKHGGGSIINLASTRALMSEPDSEAYAATKGGILSLTHALAVSLGPDHIRVNAISPGWIETGDYEKLRQEDHLQHPSQRVGKPEDIARACLFLTDPNNDFINGVNLVIDGGMTRKMIYLE